MLNELTQVLSILYATIKNLQAVYLFGSYQTMYENQGSDIDIAILAETALNTAQCWKLAQEIARVIHRDVDLVDLREASTVFRYEIITSGKRVYCRDAKVCDFFETMVCSMYLRFNDERQDLLDEIKKTGRIFHG